MTRIGRARGWDADVLIVGAGIAGLTAAAKLSALGLRVEVVEREPAPSAAGAGIMLHPNALEHLAHLRPGLAESGSEVERQLIVDESGAVTSVCWRNVWKQRLPLAVHRRRLAELMVRHLPPELLRWSMAPASLHQDADAVQVGFTDGEQRRYRLVVGADGVHSWVRRAMGTPGAPRYLGQLYWRTTIVAAAPYIFPEWRVWRGGGHFFGAMPIGEGRMHVFLQAGWPALTRIAPARAEEQMRRIVATMGPTVNHLLAELDPEEGWEVRPALGLSVARWVHGRVAIMGDAAHSVPPATTQGGGLAVEDAAILACEVRRHGAGPAALAAYEARRLPRVAAFTRVAYLHSALMELAPTTKQSRPTTGADAGRWMRRLYQPLQEPL